MVLFLLAYLGGVLTIASPCAVASYRCAPAIARTRSRVRAILDPAWISICDQRRPG
jgi:hypothetical protein